MPHLKLIALSLAAMLLAALAPAGEAWAQIQVAVQGPVVVEAVAGEPFGVGRIIADLPPDLLPTPLGIDGLGVSDKDGRVLYPALRSRVIGPLVKEILGADSPLTSGGPVRQQVGGLLRDVLVNRPPRATIYFLFRGDGPLALDLQARRPIPLQVMPRQDAVLHRQWLEAWWAEYAAPPPAAGQEAGISAAGGKLPDEHAGAAAEPAAAANRSRPNRPTPDWNTRRA